MKSVLSVEKRKCAKGLDVPGKRKGGGPKVVSSRSLEDQLPAQKPCQNPSIRKKKESKAGMFPAGRLGERKTKGETPSPPRCGRKKGTRQSPVKGREEEKIAAVHL